MMKVIDILTTRIFKAGIFSLTHKIPAFSGMTMMTYEIFGTICIFLIAGCATLNISIDEKKSTQYEYATLPQHWKHIENTKADASFWSEKSAATIFINSLCRRYENTSLHQLTRNLLLGIQDISIIKTESIMLDEREAKHTIATGKLDGVAVKMNIYVTRKNYCIYDMSYSAIDKNYDIDLSDFEKLVSSLKSW